MAMGTALPMIKRVNRRDLAFGGLMMLLALFALWESRNYEMGTADQMSTGYMPWLISVLLLSVGAIIAVRAFWRGAVVELEPQHWLRPLVAISASLPIFMFVLDRLGLVASSIVLVLISGLASRELPAGEPRHLGCGACDRVGGCLRLSDRLAHRSVAEMSDILSHLSLGFSVALSLQNLAFCFLGCVVGTLIGVLPGLGPAATAAMLIPLTFYLEPVTGLIMLAGIFYGANTAAGSPRADENPGRGPSIRPPSTAIRWRGKAAPARRWPSRRWARSLLARSRPCSSSSPRAAWQDAMHSEPRSISL